ncbi:MAG: fabA-like domain protein [Nevskia sp.]|nr:fabA-like domain protein [Nevskia sp.]
MHPCLPGHFPGRPLVPAVLLLECTAQALRERLGALRIIALHSAKFLAPVLPGQIIELQIAADQATGRARFRLQVEGRLAAHGELGFARR